MSSAGDNNQFLSNEKGHFSLNDQNDWTSQSGPPSQVVSNILVGPNQNGLFHFIESFSWFLHQLS